MSVRAKPHIRLHVRTREAVEFAGLSVTGRGPMVQEWAISTSPGYCAQWHTYWYSNILAVYHAARIRLR